jgi:tetratricopeptide (TPR) repeat protein
VRRLIEQEEVTALDLVVGLRRGRAVIEPPDDLETKAFEVRGDFASVPVVAVDLEPRNEPWRLLVCVDRRFARLATLRWATMALAELAPVLVELGDVEVIVVDDGETQTLVAPTRDAALVDEMLSGLFLGAARHSLVDLREEFTLAAEELNAEERQELAAEAGAEERRLIADHLDEILHRLVEPPGTARRALLLVSDGFDASAGAFYGLQGQADGRIAELASDWAATVAAYGWSLLALTTPVSEEASFGFEPASDVRTVGGKTPGLTARLDGNLDPERAAALHELGQSQAEQGKWQDAEASLRDALHYYYDHPKYARQRAAVLVDLGKVLLAREETRKAREVLRRAVELDPERASEFPFASVRLEAPERVLEEAVAASAGRVTRDAATLSSALDELAERIRLTVQLEGPPDGALHPVEVVMTSGALAVEAPRWIRFGTPASVQGMRARRLLDGHLETGDLEIKARFVERERGYGRRGGELDLELPGLEAEGEGGTADRRFRLLVMAGDEDQWSELVRQDLVLEGTTAQVPLSLQGEPWLAVVLDDPTSESWGGAVVEP